MKITREGCVTTKVDGEGGVSTMTHSSEEAAIEYAGDGGAVKAAPAKAEPAVKAAPAAKAKPAAKKSKK